ncbi:MAG: hypothetical protein J6W96_02190, partial [Alphaproteobacteria bacterium]|nr:hypothetical protein [Alphaproteobacteria bacterium]
MTIKILSDKTSVKKWRIRMIRENPTNLAPDFYMPKNNNVFGMDGHLISPNKRFPSMEAIIYAINNIKGPLGEGEEAKVYKIDTAPDYTVRVSKSAPDIETLSTMIWEQKFIAQENIFEDRNYAQAIAYMGLDTDDATRAMVTINLYVPGFSMDIASAEEMDDDIGKAKKQLSDLIKEDKPEEAKILKEAIEILDIAENG